MFRNVLHKMRDRLAPIAGAILLTIGAPLVFGAAPAHAANCDNYCYDYCVTSISPQTCLNAWNGGPWVMTESDAYSQPDSQFNVYATGSGSNVEIEFLGGTSWGGDCVGDAYNSSSYADTSLDECPTSGDAGWGTNFRQSNCTSGGSYGYDFYNNHWGGYLEPEAAQNDVHFYLNSPTPYCFIPVEQIHS